jgi:serine protease AprX
MAASGLAGDLLVEAVKTARKRTLDALGSEVETKATDEFCLSFTGTARAHAAEAFGLGGAESVATRLETTTAILELKHEPEPAAQPEGALESDVASAVRERVAELLSRLPDAETAVSALVRQARVKAARDAFFRRSGLLRDDVERATSAVLRASLGRPSIAETERPLVEVCWLNSTIRTADARAITNVASDANVERIDVPHRLMPDARPRNCVQLAAEQARASYGLTGRGVTVAVIDSECALGHPALHDRVIHRLNYTEEPWGTPGDHGTAVAGIIGAASDEYTGIAPEVTIYNYKVLATHIAFNATNFHGAVAIQNAVEDGVRIANCSWGPRLADDRPSREAVACDTAWQLGLAVVKSAGNRGPNASTLTTPADASGVIVVGATDDDGHAVESYSSRGPTPDGRERPHVVAPGGKDGVGMMGLLPGGGVGDIGYGTSFAAPHVAGLLALLIERTPGLSPEEQRERLLRACRQLDDASINQQGHGCVSPELLLSGS